MSTKQTIVDRIDVAATGFIQIRMQKLTLQDGNVIWKEYHRTALEPGGDVDAQLAAVNVHLKQMGYPSVDGWDLVREAAIATWTPECLKAWHVFQDAVRLKS